MTASVINPVQYTCVAEAILARGDQYPHQIAVEIPTNLGGHWRKITAAELAENIRVIGCGWIGLGMKPGDRVAIMGATSWDWVLLDLGAQAAGLVTVPIYDSDSPEQISWILEDANVKIVVTDNAAQERMVKILAAQLPLPDQVQSVFSLADSAVERILEYGRAVTEEELLKRVAAVDQNSLCTIVYTSGTTGKPKGVELSHRNFLSALQAVMFGEWRGWIYEADSRVIIFLPLAHVLARFISYQMLVGHGTVAYLPNVKTLVKDLQDFRPKAILVVPRVLEKIYNAADAQAGTGMRVKIFRSCARIAESWGYKVQHDEPITWRDKLQLKIARKLVLDKITAMMGGNVEGMVSGGAPLAHRLGYFFTGCGIEVLEGYGCTETTGPLCMSLRSNNLTGSVGPVLAGNQIRLDEDGELQARGDSIMLGYHNNPTATSEVFTKDGWFKTGDLAQIDERGRVHITGRKKEIIVTAGGKNVAPAILEERLKGHPLVSQVMVVGDQQPYVAALVTLDKEMLPTWLANHGIENMDVTRAARDPRVLETLEKAVKRTNRAVSRAESIRKIKVLTTDFTVENGLLTASLKLKRDLVAKKYATTIAGIYADKSAISEGSKDISEDEK